MVGSIVLVKRLQMVFRVGTLAELLLVAVVQLLLLSPLSLRTCQC